MTGREILESSLGRVPSAANSTTVGHMTVRKVNVSVPVPATGTTSTPLFNLAGLKIVHSCASGTEDQSLTASVTAEGLLELLIMEDSNPPVGQFRFANPDYLPSQGKTNLLVGDPNRQDGFGHLIWNTASGKVLTFDFEMEGNALSQNPDNCTLAGTVIAG